MLQNLLIRNAIIFISAFKEKGVCTLRGRNEERKEEGRKVGNKRRRKERREGGKEEAAPHSKFLLCAQYLPWILERKLRSALEGNGGGRWHAHVPLLEVTSQNVEPNPSGSHTYQWHLVRSLKLSFSSFVYGSKDIRVF